MVGAMAMTEEHGEARRGALKVVEEGFIKKNMGTVAWLNGTSPTGLSVDRSGRP